MLRRCGLPPGGWEGEAPCNDVVSRSELVPRRILRPRTRRNNTVSTPARYASIFRSPKNRQRNVNLHANDSLFPKLYVQRNFWGRYRHTMSNSRYCLFPDEYSTNADESTPPKKSGPMHKHRAVRLCAVLLWLGED